MLDLLESLSLESGAVVVAIASGLLAAILAQLPSARLKWTLALGGTTHPFVFALLVTRVARREAFECTAWLTSRSSGPASSSLPTASIRWPTARRPAVRRLADVLA